MAKEKEQLDATLKAVIERVDPEVILIGVLGGIAAEGGIVPPLTRILISMGSPEAGSDLQEFAPGGTWNPIGLGPGLISFLIDAVSPSRSQDPEAVKGRALFASGMTEAMLMYAAAKNPGTMQLLGALVNKIPSI